MEKGWYVAATYAERSVATDRSISPEASRRQYLLNRSFPLSKLEKTITAVAASAAQSWRTEVCSRKMTNQKTIELICATCVYGARTLIFSKE